MLRLLTRMALRTAAFCTATVILSYVDFSVHCNIASFSDCEISFSSGPVICSLVERQLASEQLAQ